MGDGREGIRVRAGARADARPRLLLAILILLAALRIWLGTLPGYPPDLNTYKRWALVSGLNGIHTVYDSRGETGREWRPGDYDYPPLYAYLLAPIGAIYGRIDPDITETYESSRTLGFLVKIPPLVFDALLGALLALIAARYRLWRGRRSWIGWGAAFLYLLQPAVLFDSGYWGQPDSIHVFFIVLALTLILLRRPEWGWISAALGCLMKPLAVPFIPLLALATLLRGGGWRRLVTGGAAALGTGVVLFLPFFVTGRGGIALQRFLGDVTLGLYTSINAHNLWWLLGPWRSSREPWIGPIDKTTVGMGLFGIAYLYILWRLWRVERVEKIERPERGAGARPDLEGQDRWYIAAAGIAFSFFYLSTQLHENHLFTAIPFFALLAYRGRGWAALAAIVGLVSFVNMADHDLLLSRFLFRGDPPSALVIPGSTWHMPATEFAIATANALATGVSYVGAAWAVIRGLRAREG